MRPILFYIIVLVSINTHTQSINNKTYILNENQVSYLAFNHDSNLKYQQTNANFNSNSTAKKGDNLNNEAYYQTSITNNHNQTTKKNDTAA